jgi:hypothetical protein
VAERQREMVKFSHRTLTDEAEKKKSRAEQVLQHKTPVKARIDIRRTDRKAGLNAKQETCIL